LPETTATLRSTATAPGDRTVPSGTLALLLLLLSDAGRRVVSRDGVPGLFGHGVPGLFGPSGHAQARRCAVKAGRRHHDVVVPAPRRARRLGATAPGQQQHHHQHLLLLLLPLLLTGTDGALSPSVASAADWTRNALAAARSS
jgi:hypothetical protein